MFSKINTEHAKDCSTLNSYPSPCIFNHFWESTEIEGIGPVILLSQNSNKSCKGKKRHIVIGNVIGVLCSIRWPTDWVEAWGWGMLKYSSTEDRQQ